MLRRPSFSSLSSCTFSSGSGRSSNSGSGGRSHHGSHRHHGGVPMTMVTGHLPSSVNPQYLEGTKVLRRRRRRRHFTSGGDTEQSNVGDGGATAVAVVAAWKEGIIQDVVLCEDLDEDERKSVVGGTGDADLLVVGDTRVCTVVYNKSDGGGGSGGRKNDVERLVVNETLDIWITAHFMAKLCGGGDDVRSSSTANMPPPLFSKLNASSPYSIDEFLKLMDFGVGADPEEGDDDEGEGTEDDGTTTSAQLEALEGNILVKKKSNPTEVYGRMLPRAVHVSGGYYLTVCPPYYYFFSLVLTGSFFSSFKYSYPPENYARSHAPGPRPHLGRLGTRYWELLPTGSLFIWVRSTGIGMPQGTQRCV